jgi:hypothetical protein
MVRNTEKENTNGLTVVFMMEIGRIIKLMGMANINGQIKDHMKVNFN